VAGDLLVFGRGDGAPRVIDTAGVDVTHLAWRGEEYLFFAGLRGLMTVFAVADVTSRHVRELLATAESCGHQVPYAVPFPPAVSDPVGPRPDPLDPPLSPSASPEETVQGAYRDGIAGRTGIKQPGDAFVAVLHSYTRYPELVVVRSGTPSSVLRLAHAGSDYL